MKNTAGVVVYHIVFATAHVAGKKIMGAVMQRAREVLPRLIEEEKARGRAARAGGTLFESEWQDELEAIVIDPGRYARLIIDTPGPYVPGGAKPAQGDLFTGW